MNLADKRSYSVNVSRTGKQIDTPLTQRRSRPVRWRFVGPDGHKYAPFRVKPGVTLHSIAEKAFSGEVGWGIEVA